MARGPAPLSRAPDGHGGPHAPPRAAPAGPGPRARRAGGAGAPDRAGAGEDTGRSLRYRRPVRRGARSGGSGEARAGGTRRRRPPSDAAARDGGGGGAAGGARVVGVSPVAWGGHRAATHRVARGAAPGQHESRLQPGYFVDGLTEALIADLSKIRALRVVSRRSVMLYKAVAKPLPQIARELHVDAPFLG